jgi:LysR family transcriptional regulator, glycine cleavage system transcriptional activator
VSMRTEEADAYWLAFPPNLADWPPLMALREWLLDELAASQRELDASKEPLDASHLGD